MNKMVDGSKAVRHRFNAADVVVILLVLLCIGGAVWLFGGSGIFGSGKSVALEYEILVVDIRNDIATHITPGAEVIPELKADPEKDFIVPKRHYSGFFGTDLNILLRDLGVDTCVICGLHAHMCCRHTGADAYQYGFDLVIPEETTGSFTKEDYLGALEYFKATYGGEVCKLDDLISRF